MKIDVVTLFPDLFDPFVNWSMIRKARSIKALDLSFHDLRNWAIDKRGTVDGHPYSGGPGMILRPEPIDRAITALKKKNHKAKVVLTDPRGKKFDQKKAEKLSKGKNLIIICGHYEGVDQRVRKYLVDEEISIGDFILSGGEIAAMVIIDAVSRLLPKVLEKEGASKEETFSPGLEKIVTKDKKEKLLEYPQYTRPENFKGHKVPKVLLSGNHQQILKWKGKKIIKKYD
jgi:tRNA (guanine37-N1)-methyltransferase